MPSLTNKLPSSQNILEADELTGVGSFHHRQDGNAVQNLPECVCMRSVCGNTGVSADVAVSAISEISKKLEQFQTNQTALWQAHQDLEQELRRVMESIQAVIAATNVNISSAVRDVKHIDNDHNFKLSPHSNEALNNDSLQTYDCSKGLARGIECSLDWKTNEGMASEWGYEFNETVWDCMVFCGMGVMTRTSTFIMILIGALNIGIQAGFVGLALENMTHGDFQDSQIIEDVRDWRVSYAHNPAYADALTGKPLGMGICEMSDFVMEGAQQADFYKGLDAYLSVYVGAPAGAVLCLFSIFLWILTCAKELETIIFCCIGLWTPNDVRIRSIWDIKRSYVRVLEPSVLWIDSEAKQQNYQLFFSASRAVILTVFIIIPRLLVLGFICVAGIKFLAATIDLPELILNAVALEVVLNVDELLFEILIPEVGKRMVNKSTPLRVPRFFRTRVFGKLYPPVKIVLLVSLMATIGFYVLRPMTTIMQDTADVMCYGSLDFLAVELASGIEVALPVNLNAGIDRSSHQYQAILQRIDNPVDGKLYYGELLFGSFASMRKMQEMKDWTIAEEAAVRASDATTMPCIDDYRLGVSPAESLATWSAMKARTGNANIANCPSALPYCISNTLAGQSIRFVCSRTCGGGDPLSGQIMDSPLDGMPQYCHKRVAERLAEIPCEEKSVDQLRMLPGWLMYARSARSFFEPVYNAASTLSDGSRNETHYNIFANEMTNGMLNLGCRFFQNPQVFRHLVTGQEFTIDFCNPQDELLGSRRSVRPFCPVTCGCTTHVKATHKKGTNWTIQLGQQTWCAKQCWD